MPSQFMVNKIIMVAIVIVIPISGKTPGPNTKIQSLI